MAAHRHSVRIPGLAVRPDRPLICVVLVEDGEEVVQYFADEADADAAITQLTTGDRSLAGAWADLDWDDAIAALDQIRHENEPTPPIDTLRVTPIATASSMLKRQIGRLGVPS